MQQLEAHLSILGLTSTATHAELRAAYWREIKKWHPDRFYSDPAMLPQASERAKSINAAHEYLSELLELGPLPNPNSTVQQPYRTKHTYNRQPFVPGFPDPEVFEVFIKSSHIISTGYSRAKRMLYIKFSKTGAYCYYDVPETVFTAFLSAESHGKFAQQHIYHQYRYARC